MDPTQKKKQNSPNPPDGEKPTDPEITKAKVDNPLKDVKAPPELQAEKDSQKEEPKKAPPKGPKFKDILKFKKGPTPEEKIKELEELLKESEKKYLYLAADLENVKKHAVKERSQAMKFGWESTARELLTVADNLERALAFSSADQHKALIDGLTMVMKQLQDALGKGGVRPLDAIGKPFDPNYHEAAGQEPSDQKQGHVAREEAKGYMIHDRLLRPSRVILSDGNKKKKD